MVGDPKTLQDLRRIEAGVQVTCRGCQAVTLLDREETIASRLFHRLSCDWTVVRQQATCGKCGGSDVRVMPLPFADNAPALRARRAQMVLMNLAVQVLSKAASEARSGAVPEASVRLALRVLHPLVDDQAMLTTYWTAVTAESQSPWGGGHQALRWIIKRLVDRGYPVWAELR